MYSVYGLDSTLQMKVSRELGLCIIHAPIQGQGWKHGIYHMSWDQRKYHGAEKDDITPAPRNLVKNLHSNDHPTSILK